MVRFEIRVLVCSVQLLTAFVRFTTVFADALPPDYLVRLWDVFLFEGLFRAHQLNDAS